jgi:adenylate cyclase
MGRWIKGGLIGLATGLVGALLAVTPLYGALEHGIGLPWLFHLRGAIAPPAEVAVVAINGQTGAALGLGALPRDWPRTIHARLIDALVERGASVIVFDVDFRQPKVPEDDQALADAMARAGRVVLFEHLDGKRQPILDAQGQQRGSVWVESLHQPLPALAQAARGLGPFPLPKLEASLDQFWVFKSSARDVPTMPAVAVQVHALGVYPELLARLQALAVPGVDTLPPQVEAIQGAEGLRQLMLALRRTFEQAPGLAGRLGAVGPEIAARQMDPAAPTERLLAALFALYGGPNERPLNFYGPPWTVPTVPYQAVIQARASDPAPGGIDLRGKVVFVGFSDLFDPGQPDRFYTVFTRDDGVDLSGVEIAATAVGNLLSDRSLRAPDAWMALGGLLLFGLLLGAILYLLPALIGVPLAILLAALYAAGAQFAFNGADLWLPVATPLLVQFPLALFVGLIGHYLLERGKVRHISEAMRYYLPESVHRELTGRTLDPASVNRVVFSTCLATDMSGFSTIAEQMKPGDLAKFLNDYFDSLAQPLKRHGVDVTEFRADAIMCAWTGDPLDPGVRKQPILASLEAAHAIAAFKDRHQMAGAKLRIGMEAGEVYVGHAGGGGHFVYSIVGDSANTASRIEGLNKHLGTQILATRSVAAGFDTDLLLRPLGRFRFVGKTDALPIVEVLAHRGDATPAMTDLCDRFAEALDRFGRADWTKASELFNAILGRYPQDGPSGFYLDLCERYGKGQAPTEDPGIVNMTAK